MCVIGGGYAGLSAAIGLRARGIENVVLLESETIGHGCSGRNGGFVFSGFNLDEDVVIKQVGLKHAQKLYRHSERAVDIVRQNIATHKIDCDVNESGILLANWFYKPEILSDYKDLMARHFGVELGEYGLEECREILKSHRYFGALHEHGAFHFHPLKYIRGLADIAAKIRVQVYEHTPATDLTRTGKIWRVKTPDGTISAKTIILAGSAYMAGLHDAYDKTHTPVATYVMATEPIGDKLPQAINTGAAVYDTRFNFDYYRPLPDTRILWGGRISAFDMNPGDIKEQLYSDMLTVYPQLEGTKITHAWPGIMSYARHKMPVIAKIEEGAWMTHSFGGHGVALTHLIGDMIAGAVANKETDWHDFADYYRPKNSYGLLGKIAAEMTYRYYIMRDRMRG